MTNSTTPQSAHPAGNPPSLLLLRIFGALTALGALVQAALGGSLVSGTNTSLVGPHGISGLITMVCAVVAGIAAGLWARQGGNTGLMWHALTVAVLGVLQYGLGEAIGSSGGMKIVHVIVGLLFLVAALGLATLAFRKPYAANPHDPLNEATHGEHHPDHRGDAV